MSKKIAIIGGGGFAKEIIEVAEMNGYEIYGIFAKESSLDDYRYCGYLDELKEAKDNFDGVHIAIGAVNKKGIDSRRVIIEFLKEHNIKQISLISPLATLAKDVKVGNGVYIGHKVLISVGTVIGDSVLFNHSSIVGHDCNIEDNVSIAPLVFLGGGVIIEKDVMIGVRSTIRQGIKIGKDSIIGMCSVIIKNIKANSLTLPTPTKIYR
jgi:sugar O-acyltransferase (sialic acid O-acetyltransferase NeuD family)